MKAITVEPKRRLQFSPLKKESQYFRNQPIRLPGLKPGVCSGLILSGTFCPDLKSGFSAVERINESP